MMSDRMSLLHFREFGAKCSSCLRNIQASDWVRKARNNVYHLACFSCAICARQLSTGEEFALQDTRVYCKVHYIELLEANVFSPSNEGTCYHRPGPFSNSPFRLSRAKKFANDFYIVCFPFFFVCVVDQTLTILRGCGGRTAEETPKKIMSPAVFKCSSGKRT